MTYSAPQMVLTVIQLVALSVAGQRVWANETSHILQSLVACGENQQPSARRGFSFSPRGFSWVTFYSCNVCNSEARRRRVGDDGTIMINGNGSSYYCNYDLFKFYLISGVKIKVEILQLSRKLHWIKNKYIKYTLNIVKLRQLREHFVKHWLIWDSFKYIPQADNEIRAFKTSANSQMCWCWRVADITFKQVLHIIISYNNNNNVCE